MVLALRLSAFVCMLPAILAVRKQSSMSKHAVGVTSTSQETDDAEWNSRHRRRRNKEITEYDPVDDRLIEESIGEPMTFYMYRSQGPAKKAKYPLENVNAASLGGVLWYLHNEIIFTCNGAGGVMGSRTGGTGIVGERKFSISRILRFKMTVRATTPLLKQKMNFGILCSYDAGKCTGPHRNGFSSEGEWDQFGYAVGCGRIGDWPHKDWSSGQTYPDAIWYSLPGPCPSQPYYNSSDACKIERPGGRCPPGVVPTGKGNCTYQYEEAGEIDIDELVGITPKWKSRAEFCEECKTEGNAEESGGCGLNFWGKNISDETANHAQVKAASALFQKKYPDSAHDTTMQPKCDWNMARYFLSWR